MKQDANFVQKLLYIFTVSIYNGLADHGVYEGPQ
ncbi:hypothetical protein SAMN05216563_11572 [Phytobacter palmae]|nr:hypothetical protein SAMN05216563_11572 [Phytobacter palmae]